MLANSNTTAAYYGPPANLAWKFQPTRGMDASSSMLSNAFSPPTSMAMSTSVSSFIAPQPVQAGAGLQSPAINNSRIDSQNEVAQSKPPVIDNHLAELSEFTLANSGHGLKSLNLFLNNFSFVAAALHGGYKLRGIQEKKLKTRPGWYEPNKYAGIWPGIYGPKQVARRHLMDTALSLSCSWDSFDAFAKYSSDTGSVGSGLAAGLTEAVNQFGFNFFYAEPIIFRTMDLTMRLLAKALPKTNLHKINRELAGKVPKHLVKNGIPLYYRLTRSLVGGTAGVLLLNGIISSFSKWITPQVVYYVGPVIDWLYANRKPAWIKSQKPKFRAHQSSTPNALDTNA